MERPRYWTKQLKLPCALEHAVLRTRVFRRPEAWTPSFFQKALAIQGDLKPGCEIENGLVFPLEDPLLVASDRIRKHYDEVDEGATFPRCWAKLVKTHDLFQKEDDNDEVETLMIAHSIPQDSSRAGDSLAVFEVSDGVLTETGSLLSGIELREVFDRCIKLLDVLTCPCHNQTHCSGCRGRYRLDTQSQPIPIPPYSTDLGEIELFNGIEEEGIPLTAKAIWNNFALALIDYYAYIEDWLPELVSARSFNLQETVSLIPTSTDSLYLVLEIRTQNEIPSAPINWLLNDRRPEVGTVCRVLPTNETAIFLKTLRLGDTPRLEDRLLMGVERILGRRAVTGLSAEDTINTGQFSQVIWSLLWIPNEFTADSWNVSTESLTSGQHRLWPKSLLSPIGDVRSNNSDTSSLSVPIELAEHHIGVKKPTALYKESLEIQTTMQLFEKQQASTIQEKTKLNNGSPSGSDIPLQKDSVNHGIGGSGEFLPAVDHADEEEDDDDLFASSPSPALVEDPITFHDTALGQEKPIAMDSVDEASASMFTPTHQPESHLAPAKYDVSPTDPDGRNKTYQIGFETMITDDDFNFFDANAEVPLSVGIQQMPYEEYGDLSDADFGVNLNQPPTEEVLVPDGNPGAHSHENFANTDIADRLPCVAQANDEVDIGGADLNNETMVATPQSDNDLWNDESDMAGHIPVEVEVNVECAFDMKDPMLPSQSMPLNLAETQQHTLVNISSAPAHDETANAPAMILPLNTALMPQEHHEELGRDSIDYRQPLEWTLVDTTEKMIPVGFDEVSFKSLTHGNDRNGRPRGLALEGICIADKYGDGRVRHRPQLLQLLKQEASFLQQQAHPRLPFHLEGLDFEVEACSPKSTDTGSDNVFSDSLDDASEITALSNTGDGSSDKQGLFTLGQYPFSSDEHLLSTGAFVVLEDHDSITLRKRFTESKHSGEYFNSTSMAKPHIWQSASTFCRREFYEGSSYANRNCNTATPCPSPLKFSESCEYVADDQGCEIDTRVRLGLQGNVLELSSTSLSYWSELRLEPISGRKDVTATVLYQKGIHLTEVKAFFLGTAKAYANMNYGSHTLATGGKAIQELDGDIEHQVSTLYSDIAYGGYRICYVLLLPGSISALALPSIEPRDANKGFTVLPTFLQDLSHPKAYSCLSSKVYHLLQHGNSSSSAGLQFPSFILVPSPSHKTIGFAIRWPPPALDMIEGERTLHVAYSFQIQSESMLVWLIDESGQAWREHECRASSMEMAVQEVWAYAMAFTSMANVHWRIVIAKRGDLSYLELKAWHFIFREESQAASGAFQAELLVCKSRPPDDDTVPEQTSRIKYLLHRQCVSIEAPNPTWISPLCSLTIQHGSPPGSRYPHTPFLDLHLLLRMSTESAGFMQSSVQVLTRIAQQYDGLRVLGIHRWFFAEHTPLPAHLHAIGGWPKEKST